MSKGIPPGALMPFFSPDGTYLVFNDYAIDEARGVALTRYDTKAHTASDYAPIFKEPAGAMRPAACPALPASKPCRSASPRPGAWAGAASDVDARAATGATTGRQPMAAGSCHGLAAEPASEVQPRSSAQSLSE
jgi:hypothetical protein